MVHYLWALPVLIAYRKLVIKVIAIRTGIILTIVYILFIPIL